jgi:hypothetical protein
VEVVTVKVDRATKRRMAKLREVNWSEVIREAIRRRLDLEEGLRAPFDQRRAMIAAKRMDEFRKRIGPVDFDSTKEIRKWRDRDGSRRRFRRRDRDRT